MVLASDGTGTITPLDDIYIRIPGEESFNAYAIPEFTDTKTAQYSDVLILGRSSPLKTYAGSDHRSIGITFHLHSPSAEIHSKNLQFIRALSSLVYPRYEGGYSPPPIAELKVGTLFHNSVVCINVTVPYNIETAWVATSAGDANSPYMPLYVPLQADFHAVYAYDKLPGASDVIKGKY